jgi:radical SAM protein with 4Fe4S-binding SPASM domain
VRKDLPAILSAIHRARPKVSLVLSSSAALPKRLLEAVESALAEGLGLHVGVSLDGVGPRHDEIRGRPGLFAKVEHALDGLAALRKRYPDQLGVSVGFVFSDRTFADTATVRDYATVRGFDFNVQWYNQGAYYDNEARPLLSPTPELRLAARDLPPTPLNRRARDVLDGRRLDCRCTLLHNSCLVKSNGDMVACFKYWNDSAGNIRQRTPSAVWRSQQARQARAKVRACRGCLNTCGVGWSLDANYLGRLGWSLRRLARWRGGGSAP